MDGLHHVVGGDLVAARGRGSLPAVLVVGPEQPVDGDTVASVPVIVAVERHPADDSAEAATLGRRDRSRPKLTPPTNRSRAAAKDARWGQSARKTIAERDGECLCFT